MASLKLFIFAIPYYFYFVFISFINFNDILVNALNVGIQKTGDNAQLGNECSRKCESQFCSVPPFMKYGKYCGFLYSGCPGEPPCDGLDACCMKHDQCIEDKGNDYLNQECSQQLLDCMESFKKAGAQSFKGSTCDAKDITENIKFVMQTALVAGGVLKKP